MSILDNFFLKKKFPSFRGIRFWYAFGTLLVHCWYTVGTLLVHCWYTVGKLLVHCWYTVGTLLVHCWYTVGTLLVHLLVHCWYAFGTRWYRFGTVLVRVGTVLVRVGTVLVRVGTRWYMLAPYIGILPYLKSSLSQTTIMFPYIKCVMKNVRNLIIDVLQTKCIVGSVIGIKFMTR